MVRLFCLIVGVAGSAIEAGLDDSASVAALKDEIWSKIKAKLEHNARYKSVIASDLKLFLAKKETDKDTNQNAWLQSDSEDVKMLKKGEKTAAVEALISVEELQGESGLQEALLDGMPTPSTGEIHVLVVVPEGVSTPVNERKRKRMGDEDAPDAWLKAIKDEQITALPPTCAALKEHLERELRVKVPIDDTLREMVSTVNLSGEYTCTFNKLFEHGKLSHRTATIVAPVIEPVIPSFTVTTEETYHHLWDSLIAVLLKRVSDGKFSRNTNASTSTGLKRPDLCFYYKNSDVCVFRGEEKASGELQVPVNELHDKLIWKYDAAPYIFGYAAVGLQVCLTTIRKDETTTKKYGAKVEIIETYDLGDLQGRLSFFLALLNLSTLFRPVVDLILPLGIPEYGIIERANGVQIAFAEDCVMKTYPQGMPSDGIIRNLRNLHQQMKEHSVPNIVELKGANMRKKHVTLAPVGQLSPPENVHQLLTALRDILEALVALHAIKLMHRDLRWENVLRYPGEGDKWFLIDFDEGATSPAKKVTHLKAESHAPEILSASTHTVKVDIWSVGYLLKASPVQDLPPELNKMKADCLRTKPSSRPTAKTLLRQLNSLLSRGF